MKMQIVSGSEVAKIIGRNRVVRSVYNEIYQKVDALEKGQALVVDYEDEKKATMLASALSAHVCHDNKNGYGRFVGCYYTKARNIVVIGKN